MAAVTIVKQNKTTHKFVTIETTTYVVVSVAVNGTEATVVAWGAKDPSLCVELNLSAGNAEIVVDYVCSCAGVITANGVFTQTRYPGLVQDIEVALGRF